MANPVWIQTMITIRNRLFHGCNPSQATGSCPRPCMTPFNSPMFVPNPYGR